MSLLLRLISKLSLTKKPVSSCFSTVTKSRSKPYLYLDTKLKENILFNLYDPTRNKEVVKNLNIQDQTLKNIFQESELIGCSRGHLALRNEEDSSVHLVDISSQKIICLPPLNFGEFDIDILSVCVSSPVNGDVTVAVKFYGGGLNLCRVGDSEWTRIDVHCCPYFLYSPLMYSERDERFYMINCNPYYPGPIDLTPESGLVTPVSAYLTFPLSNTAEFEKDFPSFSNFDIFNKFNEDYPMFSKFMVRQELVESPSGQSFIVCRFLGWFDKKREVVDCLEYKHIGSKVCNIAVFKQDEKRQIGTYTNDIGDLCIFVGANQAFCVSANDYPGLKPNSVYFAPNSVYFTRHASEFGVCDLSSQTILNFYDDLTSSPYRLFWIPPTITFAS